MNNDALSSTALSIQTIYSVFLALSLGEAFRQFVAENPNETDRKIHWDRTLNLFSFLLLIVPFFHGMNRYLFDIYINSPRPNPYSGFLLIDSVAFTFEGSFFFILARSLPRIQWRSFYLTVVFLLVLDVVWGGIVWLFHSSVIKPWFVINLSAFPLILLILWLVKSKTSWRGPILCALIVLIRTTLDYILSWNI